MSDHLSEIPSAKRQKYVDDVPISFDLESSLPDELIGGTPLSTCADTASSPMVPCAPPPPSSRPMHPSVGGAHNTLSSYAPSLLQNGGTSSLDVPLQAPHLQSASQAPALHGACKQKEEAALLSMIAPTHATGNVLSSALAAPPCSMARGHASGYWNGAVNVPRAAGMLSTQQQQLPQSQQRVPHHHMSQQQPPPTNQAAVAAQFHLMQRQQMQSSAVHQQQQLQQQLRMHNTMGGAPIPIDQSPHHHSSQMSAGTLGSLPQLNPASGVSLHHPHHPGMRHHYHHQQSPHMHPQMLPSQLPQHQQQQQHYGAYTNISAVPSTVASAAQMSHQALSAPSTGTPHMSTAAAGNGQCTQQPQSHRQLAASAASTPIPTASSVNPPSAAGSAGSAGSVSAITQSACHSPHCPSGGPATAPLSTAPARASLPGSALCAGAATSCAVTAAVAPANTTTTTPSTGDPEKRKLIQQQLVLLLHAHKCQRREQSGEGHVECNLPHCQTMKNVLNHMTSCVAGKSCIVPHCSSSRQIINHWKSCKRADCPVCLPLKQAETRRTMHQQQQQQQRIGSRPPPPPSQQPPTSSRHHLQPVCTPQSALPTPVTCCMGSQPGHGSSTASSGHETQLAPVCALSSHAVTSNGPHVAGTRTSLAVAHTSTCAETLTANANFRSLLEPVQLSPANEPKEWHGQVTRDLRSHLVGKLVEAIFPSPDASTLNDHRMHNLVSYAKRVEGEMYRIANSRSEYYHLLAEKIYKIQKDLEEKRMRRQAAATCSTQAPSSGTADTVTVCAAQCTVGAVAAPSGAVTVSSAALTAGKVSAAGGAGGVSAMTSAAVGALTPAPQQAAAVYTRHGPSLAPSSGHYHTGGAHSSPMYRHPCTPVAATQQQQLPQSFDHHHASTRLPSSCATDTTSAANKMHSAFQQHPMDAMTNSSVGVSGPPQLTGHQLYPTQLASSSSSYAQTSAYSAPMSVPPTSSHVSGTPPTHQQQYQYNCAPLTGTAAVSGSALAPARSHSDPPSSVKTAIGKQEGSSPASVGAAQTPGASKSTDIKLEPPSSVDNSTVVVKEECLSQRGPVTAASECARADTPASSAAAADQYSSAATPSSVGAVSATDTAHTVSTTTAAAAAKSATTTAARKRHKPLFSPEELRHTLMPTLEKLYHQEPESIPFRQPVDPGVLGIPDYFDIVRHPMDLSTIKRKLDTGQFSDPWQYVEDVWLMFENAWIYNRKTSKVYKFCTKLSEIFEQEIDPVMQKLGYCCGRKYSFQPQTLCCYGNSGLCQVSRDAKYMAYENRIIYCVKCFNEIPGDVISETTTTPPMSIKKDLFVEMKNDKFEREAMVECSDCGRKLHQICVLHMDSIWTQGFTCDLCLKAKNMKRRENRFMAKRLSQTKLGAHIEARVNNFLKKKESGAGEVYIRVVASGDKVCEVKGGMKARFCDAGEMTSKFPYRAKALFAFEDIDGHDVCFFGMHVQEYGSECDQPNYRRAYIAYLDSVHFFRPRQFRTAVYHEILLGYLDYVKQLGFTMGHIWACPPCEGDDYIFHCHPPDQKIPKPKRLQEWYKKMLDKGIIDRIVVDYKDILKQAHEDGVVSPAELPYFEGDYWPGILDDSIKELDQEEEEERRRQLREAAEEARVADEMDGEEKPCFGVACNNKHAQKKQNKNKNTKSKSGSKHKSKKQQGTLDLSAKIFAMMEKHKDVFFVVRLHSAQVAASLDPIQDPDPLISCEMMDGRDSFLNMARERHLEFSSLRRALASTQHMLYELFNQNMENLVTCNVCRNNVETRFHCVVCDDYDLCVSCHARHPHAHPMERVGFDLEDGSAGSGHGPGSQSLPEQRRLMLDNCIRALVHACQCRDANCRMHMCFRMRRIIAHGRSCPKRSSIQTCPLCKQLAAVCCYHAKSCREDKCVVPYCNKIKTKVANQRLQEQFHNRALLQRRIAQMHGGVQAASATAQQQPSGGAVTQAPVSCSAAAGGVAPEFGQSYQQQQTQQAATVQHSSQTHQHHVSLGSKPVHVTQTPANVLMAVKQVQEAAARQQNPSLQASYALQSSHHHAHSAATLKSAGVQLPPAASHHPPHMMAPTTPHAGMHAQSSAGSAAMQSLMQRAPHASTQQPPHMSHAMVAQNGTAPGLTAQQQQQHHMHAANMMSPGIHASSSASSVAAAGAMDDWNSRYQMIGTNHSPMPAGQLSSNTQPPGHGPQGHAAHMLMASGQKHSGAPSAMRHNTSSMSLGAHQHSAVTPASAPPAATFAPQVGNCGAPPVAVSLPAPQQPAQPAGASAMMQGAAGGTGGSTVRGSNIPGLPELLHSLRNPSGQHNQDHVLSILRSNPRLMAQVIKLQKQRQQQQHAVGGPRVPGQLSTPQQQQQQFHHTQPYPPHASPHHGMSGTVSQSTGHGPLLDYNVPPSQQHPHHPQHVRGIGVSPHQSPASHSPYMSSTESAEMMFTLQQMQQTGTAGAGPTGGGGGTTAAPNLGPGSQTSLDNADKLSKFADTL